MKNEFGFSFKIAPLRGADPEVSFSTIKSDLDELLQRCIDKRFSGPIDIDYDGAILLLNIYPGDTPAEDSAKAKGPVTINQNGGPTSHDSFEYKNHRFITEGSPTLDQKATVTITSSEGKADRKISYVRVEELYKLFTNAEKQLKEQDSNAGLVSETFFLGRSSIIITYDRVQEEMYLDKPVKGISFKGNTIEPKVFFDVKATRSVLDRTISSSNGFLVGVDGVRVYEPCTASTVATNTLGKVDGRSLMKLLLKEDMKSVAPDRSGSESGDTTDLHPLRTPDDRHQLETGNSNMIVSYGGEVLLNIRVLYTPDDKQYTLFAEGKIKSGEADGSWNYLSASLKDTVLQFKEEKLRKVHMGERGEETRKRFYYDWHTFTGQLQTISRLMRHRCKDESEEMPFNIFYTEDIHVQYSCSDQRVQVESGVELVVKENDGAIHSRECKDIMYTEEDGVTANCLKEIQPIAILQKPSVVREEFTQDPALNLELFEDDVKDVFKPEVKKSSKDATTRVAIVLDKTVKAEMEIPKIHPDVSETSALTEISNLSEDKTTKQAIVLDKTILAEIRTLDEEMAQLSGGEFTYRSSPKIPESNGEATIVQVRGIRDSELLRFDGSQYLSDSLEETAQEVTFVSFALPLQPSHFVHQKYLTLRQLEKDFEKGANEVRKRCSQASVQKYLMKFIYHEKFPTSGFSFSAYFDCLENAGYFPDSYKALLFKWERPLGKLSFRRDGKSEVVATRYTGKFIYKADDKFFIPEGKSFDDIYAIRLRKENNLGQIKNSFGAPIKLTEHFYVVLNSDE